MGIEKVIKDAEEKLKEVNKNLKHQSDMLNSVFDFLDTKTDKDTPQEVKKKALKVKALVFRMRKGEDVTKELEELKKQHLKDVGTDTK